MMKRLTILGLAIALPALARGQEQTSAAVTSKEIVVRATIQPALSKTLVNPLPGTRAIVHIVKEGTAVRKGDEIVILDINDEKTKVRELELDLALTQSDLSRSEVVIDVQKRVAEAAKADASTSVKRAEAALEAWKKNGYPLEVAAIKSSIELASAEIELASVRLKSLELAPDPLTPEERKKQREDKLESRTQLSRAKTQLRVSKLKLSHLEEFILPAKIAKLEADLKLARLRTQHDVASAEAGVASTVAEQDASQKKVSVVREQLQKNVGDLRQGVIVAPIDGVVVHAQSSSRRATPRALTAGQQVRQRQQLVIIHNLENMVAIGTCDLESAKRIMLGQKVKVEVDAYPNQFFTGTLVAITSTKGVIGETATLRVKIGDKKKARLNPGMSAMIRLMAE